jgi:hypothetical protein
VAKINVAASEEEGHSLIYKITHIMLFHAVVWTETNGMRIDQSSADDEDRWQERSKEETLRARCDSFSTTAAWR